MFIDPQRTCSCDTCTCDRSMRGTSIAAAPAYATCIYALHIATNPTRWKRAEGAAPSLCVLKMWDSPSRPCLIRFWTSPEGDSFFIVPFAILGKGGEPPSLPRPPVYLPMIRKSLQIDFGTIKIESSDIEKHPIGFSIKEFFKKTTFGMFFVKN